MNQTIENPETYIPAEDEVVANPSRTTWRFADGVICTGSKDKGTHQTREKIVGRLRRIGLHDKTYTVNGDEKRVYQLEADFETAAGPTRVAASLCSMSGQDQASGVACSFAHALLQFAKDELTVWTAAKSKEKNKFGSYSTYVNAFRLKPGSSQGTEVPRRAKTDDTLEVTLSKLLAEIKTHPAYADRPVHESDDEDGTPNTHLSAFCKECAEKGWPTPEQCPGDWLGMVAKATGQPVQSSLSGVSEDVWGELRLKLAARTETPVPSAMGLTPSEAWVQLTAPKVAVDNFG